MRIPNIPWTHTQLTAYTSGETLNAVWTAVSASVDRWETFLHYVIPVGMTARIVMRPVVQFKIYATAGTELGRNDLLMLAMQKVGKNIPIEIVRFDYGIWYDISWAEQLNKDVREALTIDTGYTQILLWENEQILLRIKNSSIALSSTPHESTLLQFPIDVITNADLARAFKARQEQELRAKGIDVAD